MYRFGTVSIDLDLVGTKIFKYTDAKGQRQSHCASELKMDKMVVYPRMVTMYNLILVVCVASYPKEHINVLSTKDICIERNCRTLRTIMSMI